MPLPAVAPPPAAPLPLAAPCLPTCTGLSYLSRLPPPPRAPGSSGAVPLAVAAAAVASAGGGAMISTLYDDLYHVYDLECV